MGANKAGVAWWLALRLAAWQVTGRISMFVQLRDDSYGSWVPKECVVCSHLYWVSCG